jgi:L-2-hydroxyglutarate oxidase
MPGDKIFTAAVIGGGIIGTATAMILQQSGKHKIILIEAEEKLASHQTGHNSGVIHSGLYYKPGSLKAKNCVRGREMMYEFCVQNNINFEQCGKVVVAVEANEISILNELYEKGLANGLHQLKLLSKDEMREYEPFVEGIAGLFVGETGIVDFVEVTDKMGELFETAGGEIKYRHKFLSVNKLQDYLILETSGGEIKTHFLINCGGLYSDRIAKLCGISPSLMIVPFRGEYYKLRREKQHLVKNLIYPVPDPQFPFLGVHFTRMIKGGVEAGPNAVLSFKREGYEKFDFSLQDTLEMMTYTGFWKMASKYYRMGLTEFIRSFNKLEFVRALQKLIPSIEADDILPGGSGVRAQALEPDGKLVDDFRITMVDKMIHVLNAPSPAATASLSIAEYICSLAEKTIS